MKRQVKSAAAGVGGREHAPGLRAANSGARPALLECKACNWRGRSANGPRDAQCLNCGAAYPIVNWMPADAPAKSSTEPNTANWQQVKYRRTTLTIDTLRLTEHDLTKFLDAINQAAIDHLGGRSAINLVAHDSDSGEGIDL